MPSPTTYKETNTIKSSANTTAVGTNGWEATWEAEENIAGCEEIVRDFFRKEL